MTRTTLTTLFLMLLYCAKAQEYSYTHYDISEGLAGSTVYCITQDKDGFIWTGTETGVSRFDGTHFHNYTTADGLSDVEILEMFADSKGRVWMAPFSKSVCYYYRGRFYNQQNDSLLGSMHFRSNPQHFAEDRFGNILIQERTALHMVTSYGTVINYDSINGSPIRYSAAISTSNTGNFFVQEGGHIYDLVKDRFIPYTTNIVIQDAVPPYIFMNPAGMIWRLDSNTTAIRSFLTGRQHIYPFERAAYRHIAFTMAGDSLFYANEFTGVTEYNFYTGSTRRFLAGQAVSRTFRDVSGNLWFTTMGHGIYRLNSDEFQSIRMNAPGMENSAVYSITRMSKRIYAGDDHNYVFTFSLPDMRRSDSGTVNRVAKNRILGLIQMPDSKYLIVSDNGLELSTVDYRSQAFYKTGLKSLFQKNKDELLVGTYWGVVRMNIHNFQIIDTIWHERATSIYYHHDTTFLGTLNGMYALPSDKGPGRFLGASTPFFQKRISALAESADGTLWVASYDAGVIGYRDGRIIATISRQQGLTSDICRTLLVHDNSLWIGTDKGLNRIRLDQPGYPISKYTSQDGLGSNIVNTIFADGPVIYVGTPAGLSYFDETRVDHSETCRLYLLSLVNSGKERIGDTAHLLLPYTDKHLRLEFAGISYRSVGDITYKYRMLGLDSAWRSTKETFLEYQTLPSGSYEFQLQAVNKFGTSSALVSLPFSVITPFWQTSWFNILVLAAFLSLIWMFVTLRIRHIHRRQRENEHLNQRMMEMEHTALQAQMNPHFIFNCLNSIQQYIFDQDIFAANKYITGFSRLIRATLTNSSKSFISLADEISYLSNYLSLEKLRFKEKMDYCIDLDPAVNSNQYIIPPMLIQPFVENSMRHGLRHKIDGKGTIRIKFTKSGNRLAVTVEDNGIGRKKAASYKTREHIEYQSKGMSLTADRIRMMNAKYNDSILINVEDLTNAEGQPEGTRVTMEFPFFHTLVDIDDL